MKPTMILINRWMDDRNYNALRDFLAEMTKLVNIQDLRPDDAYLAEAIKQYLEHRIDLTSEYFHTANMLSTGYHKHQVVKGKLIMTGEVEITDVKDFPGYRKAECNNTKIQVYEC